MSKGNADPHPLSDNEVNEMKNLKKKVDFLMDKLEHDPSAKGAATQYDTESEEDEDEHGEEDEKQYL